MIRVLVADASPRITENIVKRLSLEEDIHVAGTAREGEQAVQEALRLQPDIVLIDAAMPGMDGVQATELLAQHLPTTGVIMMSMEGEGESIRHAMLAGAREFLLKPFKGDELVAAVRRVYEFERRKVVQPGRGGSGGGGGGGHSEEHSGHIVLVLAGKGGVGKSVVAVNLAVSLAAAESRVALVDLSLQFGDVGALLDLHGGRTIADLAANDAVADRDMIQTVLMTGPGGVKVLLAPVSPELADLVTTSHLRALMEELRRTFDYVIVDTASYLNEIALEGVEVADTIVLVTDLSVSAVKNTKLVLQVLDVLKVDPGSIKLVLNHRDGEAAVDRAYAEGFLRRPVAIEMPFEPKVLNASVSEGVPFVVSSPESASTSRIRDLAHVIAPEADDAPGGAGAKAGDADKSGKKKQRRLLGFARG
jgi:pilus assembly protein CpaE